MSKQGYGRVTMHVTHHQSTGLSAVRQVTPPIQHQSESSQPLSTLQRCDAVLIMDATYLHSSDYSGKSEYVRYATERGTCQVTSICTVPESDVALEGLKWTS